MDKGKGVAKELILVWGTPNTFKCEGELNKKFKRMADATEDGDNTSEGPNEERTPERELLNLNSGTPERPKQD
ncbi:hypothetical protein IEQ34_005218 [Dendrobium chrysotoxum]|uniref:Uncharacterized protein n=1 Tax=Dendrobium chrysotoxum TaxID=161865 RepID=A0AAV7HAG4_DENCH|nr:hypothetical protein IEQ34_005218 [Dendrobium chrysotoxum]